MELHVVGGPSVTLERAHFVAAGGQGAVYARDGLAYKIYSDPASIMPQAKLDELAVLPEPRFNRPRALVVDAGGATVGYVTRFIKDAFILCQLFPRAFRERHRFTYGQVMTLVQQLRDGVAAAHRCRIILVDLNEMNFLVDPAFEQLTFIDTDSYQTPGFPGCAIMDAVRDRHMAHPQAFDERSDWFSFACVSFALFTGIHPYKGKHPTLRGLEARMQANVSVLNKDVSVPSSTYDFALIPPLWRAWYEAVLEHGERYAPPDDTTAVPLRVPPRTVPPPTHTQGLVVDTLATFPNRIQNLWSIGQHLVVATESGLWLDNVQVAHWTDTDAVLGGMGAPVAFRKGQNGQAEALSLASDAHVQLAATVHDVVAHEGRAYSKMGEQIVELSLAHWGQPVVSAQTAVHVLPQATRLFPGVVVQDLLGSCFVSLLLSGHRTPQIRLPELDDYRIIDAKWCAAPTGGVLMVTGVRDGDHEHLVFRFSPAFERYDVTSVADAGPAGINFVVTDAGVCVRLSDDGELQLTYAALGRDGMKRVTDPFLTGDLRLAKHHGQLLASRDNCLYSLKM